MKKSIRLTLIIVIIIAGFSLLIYPIVSNWIHERRQTVVINEYVDEIAAIDAELLEQSLVRAQQYNADLTVMTLVNDPFTGVKEEGADESYLAQLNLTEVMCYVEIPKIDVKLPMYHGTSAEVLARALGHLQGSSMPVGGEGTHCVITGHSGLPNALLFTNLEKLELGDMFYITVLGQTLAYQVDDISIVEPNDTSKLQIFPGEDYVTLLTCTPYGINSHRLLVRGTRVEMPEEINDEKLSDLITSPMNLGLLIAGVALIAGAVVIWFIIRRMKGSREKALKGWIDEIK